MKKNNLVFLYKKCFLKLIIGDFLIYILLMFKKHLFNRNKDIKYLQKRKKW